MSNEKSQLREGVRSLTQAAQTTLANHPAIEHLTEYRSGELNREASERIRDHLTRCRHCRDLVLDFGAFADLAQENPRPMTAETDRQWRRLEQKLRSTPEPAAPMTRPPESRWARALAAALAAAVVGLSVWVGALRQNVRELSGPRLNPPVVDLIALENPLREQASHQRIVLPAVADQVVLILNLTSWREAPGYGLEISTSPEGTVLWSQKGLVPGNAGNFTLTLPRDFLPAGRYRLSLYGVATSERQPLATFRLELVDGP